MTATTLVLILISVTMSACAQAVLKLGVAGVGAARDTAAATALAYALSPAIIGGLGLYGLSAVVWLGVLSRIQLSQAYPFVGLGFVLTALFGYLLFGDAFGVARLLGTVLVIAGVVLIGLS